MTSLFADTALAGRIERAECELSISVAGAARGRDGVEGAVFPVAGGAAVYLRPGSPLNKLIGVGFEGPIDDGALSAIEDAFSSRTATIQAEVATLADPSAAAALSRRGYVLTGFENVLGMRLSGSDRLDAGARRDVTVMEVPRGEEARWAAIAIEGFNHPDDTAAQAPQENVVGDALERIVRDMLHDGSFRRYEARVAGALAGAASLRISGDLASLAGATTLPAFRRRGVQSALMTTRLLHARAAGCELATVTVAPGSKSQENAMKGGFALLYSRALLVKEPGPSPSR